MRKFAILTIPAFFALTACRGDAATDWPTEPQPDAEIDMEPGSAYVPELEEDAEGPLQDEEWLTEGEQQQIEQEPMSGEQEGIDYEAQGPTTTLFFVDIDPEIVARCQGLTGNKIFFEFDEAKVQQQYKDELRSVATCMQQGALQNQDLMLIGMADRRGPSDYNYELGGNRADSVAQFLSKQGVKQQRLKTMSLGERYASALDAQSPAYERRVSILLPENVGDLSRQGQQSQQGQQGQPPQGQPPQGQQGQPPQGQQGQPPQGR